MHSLHHNTSLTSGGTTVKRKILLAALILAPVSVPVQATDVLDCGDTSDTQDTGTETVSGEGRSTRRTSGTDRDLAGDYAFRDLAAGLKELAGIECGDCEEGTSATGRAVAPGTPNKCRSTAHLREGTRNTTYTEIEPGGSKFEQGWKVNTSWQGTFKIECYDCIEIE